MRYVALAEAVRGSLADTVHYGALAIVDSSARLLYRAGDPEAPAFWRSAAKPVKALALVAQGAADRFRLTDAELALACSSHSGEAEHVVRVGTLLGRLGLTADDLACGARYPLDPRAAAALVRSNQEPTPLHAQCSGEHAGILALTRQLGLPTAGYVAPEHPVHPVILAHIATLTGLAAQELPAAADGCGLPTVALPLSAMATAYARLADPSSLPDSVLAAAAERVARAMHTEPYLVGGRRRFDTAMLVRGTGRWLAAQGESGVYCVGLSPAVVAGLPALAGAAGGVGMAIKVADGQARPRNLVVV